MSSRTFSGSKSFNDWLVADHEALHVLDDVEELFDWPSFERSLSKLYPGTTGRPSHPLLMLFRIVLLQHLYKITSDVAMESITLQVDLFIGVGSVDNVPTPGNVASCVKPGGGGRNHYSNIHLQTKVLT